MELGIFFLVLIGFAVLIILILDLKKEVSDKKENAYREATLIQNNNCTFIRKVMRRNGLTDIEYRLEEELLMGDPVVVIRSDSKGEQKLTLTNDRRSSPIEIYGRGSIGLLRAALNDTKGKKVDKVG